MNEYKCEKQTKSLKVKNPCKICEKSVNQKTGIRCNGACKKWAHFTCLKYTPGKIQDIKDGYIKIICPCPDCQSSQPTELASKSPRRYTTSCCPKEEPPTCDSLECPVKKNTSKIPPVGDTRNRDCSKQNKIQAPFQDICSPTEVQLPNCDSLDCPANNNKSETPNTCCDKQNVRSSLPTSDLSKRMPPDLCPTPNTQCPTAPKKQVTINKSCQGETWKPYDFVQCQCPDPQSPANETDVQLQCPLVANQGTEPQAAACNKLPAATSNCPFAVPTRVSKSCSCISSDSRCRDKCLHGDEIFVAKARKQQSDGSMYTNLEEMCKTLGQLTTQLKDLMCKIVKATQTKLLK